MRKRNETLPLWPASFKIAERPPLTENRAAAVCVVGAGIAGLSTAYQLARAGVKTIVLDAGQIGGGETERTTAHLAVALDAGYSELLRIHGGERARLAARSHSEAIDEIERIASREAVDCGFERLDGWLFSSAGDSPGAIEEEFAASRRAGIIGAEREPRAPLGAFVTGPAIRYPGQAQFHPLRYLAGLAAAFERLGGEIYCGTRVVETGGGAGARVKTEGGKSVSASAIVVATNTPFNDRFVIHTKQASYRTYAFAAPLPQPDAPRALYWDMDDPYHYVRFCPGGRGRPDGLIVGGEDHKTGQQGDPAEARFARLEAWARERFPGLGETSYRWSGQVVGTNDGLAFIGRNPDDEKNVFVVTGDCGHGMTHGTIAGMLLPELIAGRRHPWADLYDPSRVLTGSLARWTSENLNTAAQYASYLSPGEAGSVDEIRPGTGAVVRRGVSKVAVYRDENGALTERSAICPHLGAVVRWNAGEKTWDCPAHGSRFAVDGSVLNGPAAAGLREAKPDGKPRRAKRRASAGARSAPRRRKRVFDKTKG